MLFQMLWQSVSIPPELLKGRLLEELRVAYEPVFAEMTPLEIFTANNGWEVAANTDYTIDELMHNVSSDNHCCDDRQPHECAAAALATGEPCFTGCMWGLFALVVQSAMTIHNMRIKHLVFFATSSKLLPLPAGLLHGNRAPRIQVCIRGDEYARLPTSSTCFAQLKLPWRLLCGAGGLVNRNNWNSHQSLHIRSQLADKFASAVANTGAVMGMN